MQIDCLTSRPNYTGPLARLGIHLWSVWPCSTTTRSCKGWPLPVPQHLTNSSQHVAELPTRGVVAHAPHRDVAVQAGRRAVLPAAIHAHAHHTQRQADLRVERAAAALLLGRKNEMQAHADAHHTQREAELQRETRANAKRVNGSPALHTGALLFSKRVVHQQQPKWCPPGGAAALARSPRATQCSTLTNKHPQWLRPPQSRQHPPGGAAAPACPPPPATACSIRTKNAGSTHQVAPLPQCVPSLLPQRAAHAQKNDGSTHQVVPLLQRVPRLPWPATDEASSVTTHQVVPLLQRVPRLLPQLDRLIHRARHLQCMSARACKGG